MAKGARHDLKGKGKARERTYGKARDRTRGDKPRLIEDPELEERVLSSQLKEAGLYAANILGDGNCLFRALSDQLYGSPSMHQAIRQEICDYLAAHPDKYRLFVDEDSVKGGFDGHVREMRQNGTYGTNIELSAFVARYRRPVKVYQPNLVYVLPVEDKGSSATASSSSPPPPPPPAAAQAGDADKLTPRERRLKARQDKLDAKGKGKGKQRAKATDKPEAVAPPAPSATEPFDDSPLCIVYHSWEHYSSLRNISGPHTGPPRLRVGRVNSPAVNNDTAASSGAPEDESAPARDGEDEHDKEEEQEKPKDDGEDTRMDESQDTVAPPRRTPRASPPTDQPLPAVRSALARARSAATDADDADADARPVPPQPTIPIFPPSDSSASPSSPPSSSASSPPPRPASTDSTTRPPKHLLDRSLSQPRSYSPLSISSSSSAAPAATSDHDHDDADLDVNDNDRAGRRTRSRLASPASGSQRSAASSSSGTSTGVASSAAAAADDDDDELSESSSRASPAAAPAAPSPQLPHQEPATRGKGRTRAPPPRERRGPTSSEKKELARVRRLERRRAKGVHAQPVAGRADEGRVLRSGRRTSGAGGAPAPAQGDAGLGKVRELFI